MKFTILQQDLLSPLQTVARSCSVRSQLPVLSNILLQTEGGRLKLSATNLEVGIVKFINAEIIEEGELTIPAKTLVEVVVNLAGEKLEFSTNSEILEILTPTFSSKISGISAAEFPTIPLTGKEAVVMDTPVIAKSLPQVVFSAAVDDGRPILTGIFTEIKDGQLQLVATDGYRLAHKIVAVAKDINFKALVPRRTFEEVVRLISEEGAESVRISISQDQNQIIFSLGNTEFYSRLIEGQFPAWEKIIPSSPKARVVVDKNEILKAVKLASVFTRGEANIVKFCDVAPNKLILTSEAKEVGYQKKEVEAQVEGEELQIAFNTKFLLDVLGAINSSQVIMELSGNLSAALFKPMGEEGLQYIVMPVNLS